MCGAIRAALGALATLALGVGALAHPLVPGKAQERPVLLRGGDLYTVSHGVLPGTDLLFEGGKITRIERGIVPPGGAEIVDLAGRRVYPGLIAAYTSLGLVEIGAVRATRDVDEAGTVTPEVAAHVAWNPDSDVIPTVRSHGIATAQIVPAGSLINGRSFLTHLDGWTKEDAAVRLVDALQVTWPPAAADRPGRGRRRGGAQRDPGNPVVDLRRELRAAFEAARAYDLARTADPKLDVDLRWEAMRPVFKRELPVFIAADDERQIVEALAFAREFGLRAVLVGARDAYRTLDVLRESGVPVVVARPTALPLRDDEGYDAAYALPGKLHEAGIRFCISSADSDAWNERNLPLIAGMAAGYGLPPDEALRSITLSAAEILGVADELGSLDPGKQATLFVSDGDVLDALGQKVTRMWIEGREVDLDDRHKQLWRKYLQKGR